MAWFSPEWGSMLAPVFVQLPELEADTGAVRDLSIRWSADGKRDIVWKW
jgi:hypothetical protein